MSTQSKNHSNKQPDTNMFPAGTLLWYWDPLSKEQEQVMLLEDLHEEKYTYLAKVSVLYQTMKKTVWCSNLCVKRFDKKPGIKITVQSTVKLDSYPDSIILNETTIK